MFLSVVLLDSKWACSDSEAQRQWPQNEAHTTKMPNLITYVTNRRSDEEIMKIDGKSIRESMQCLQVTASDSEIALYGKLN